jgi:hypothetical protein
MKRNALFLFAFFVAGLGARAQSLMYLGGITTSGHQSHRIVAQVPTGERWQTTTFAQSLEGIHHGILGFGPVYRNRGFEITPIAGVAVGGNNGNHALVPALTIFKESHKWLFDLQALCLVGRRANQRGCIVGPVDSVWRIRKSFRLGITGQLGHWQGHANANIGPEFRYLLPRTGKQVWLTTDIKPTQLMVGGHGKKHAEVGFGLVWDLSQKEK